MRSQALLFIKRMYEKEQLREYVEKFALNYLQLLVHPNPPSVLFGADKDTGVARVHWMHTEPCRLRGRTTVGASQVCLSAKPQVLLNEMEPWVPVNRPFSGKGCSGLGRPSLVEKLLG